MERRRRVRRRGDRIPWLPETQHEAGPAADQGHRDQDERAPAKDRGKRPAGLVGDRSCLGDHPPDDTGGGTIAAMAAHNRLAGETSPYLLQHAHNPVDWYPWGPAALERARAEDKPIFLSIGYAACHWCHVMERESFEDPVTAAELTRDFIAIKVDREERPDLDQVYMAAVQAMTGQGGWPMSVFLTPDGRPFYGGTYYPSVPRGEMPAFRQVLAAVAHAWRDQRASVEASGDRLVAAPSRGPPRKEGQHWSQGGAEPRDRQAGAAGGGRSDARSQLLMVVLGLGPGAQVPPADDHRVPAPTAGGR